MCEWMWGTKLTRGILEMTVFKWTAREYSLHFDTFKKSSANRFKIGPLPNFGTLSLVLSQLLLYSPGSSIRLTVVLKVPCCFKIVFPFIPLPLSGMIFSPPLHTYRFAKPSSFAILGKRFSMTLFLLSFVYLKRSSIISLILLDCHFLFM